MKLKEYDNSEREVMIRAAIQEIERVVNDNNSVRVKFLGCNPDYGDVYTFEGFEGQQPIGYMLQMAVIMEACKQRPTNLFFE